MHLFTKQEELIMLAIFRLSENAYLVTIRKHLLKYAGKDWAFGSLYIALKRLIKNGYVQTFLGEPTSERGGKAIKYYRLTDRGIEALIEIKKLHDTMWREFSEFSLGLR